MVAQIWDPESPSTSYILEGVQFFALKLIFKNWNSTYSSLLSLLKSNLYTSKEKEIN